MLDFFVSPFGVLTKNMKYVPNVPNIRYILGTKSSPPHFGVTSIYRNYMVAQKLATFKNINKVAH